MPRVPFHVPSGYMNREESAAFLGISPWKLVILAREKRWLHEERMRGVYVYREGDLARVAERLAKGES